MDVRQKHMNNIQHRLAYLKSRVEIAGSLNLTDIHIYAEDFYQALFNLLDNSYINGNIDKQNYAFIDLIDVTNKSAMQITARNDNKKITDTIVGFFENSEHPEYKDYSLKVLLISKRAKDYSTDFTIKGKYNFNHKEDVIDIERLTAIIKDHGRKDVTKIVDISKFLDSEIDLPRPKTESNEVETIMSLLEYLSDDENYKEFDGNYICDPEQKINSRFKDYADDFKEEFTDLLAIYCNTIPEVKRTFGLDGVRAEKISYFLKFISNRYLKETNDKPLDALDKLTDYFEDKLNSNGIRADIGAIRFYLMDELIGCNIFSIKIE
ncbi:MAG: SMEK domain-containing protein [Bacteroidales bacterium]|nr:SMEK domain-containing protein [Bacteroidales bacterium]